MANTTRENQRQETVMDVTVEQIARMYAQAFMAVAEKASVSDTLVLELKSLVVDVLNNFPQLEKTLGSSLVSDEQKEQLLDHVFAKRATPQLLNFLKVLSRHGRLDLLRPIARNVEKLHVERSGKTAVEVRVATEIDAVLRDELQEQLHKAFGTQPVLNIKVDPSLIAGVVIRVGDRVYDGSVHTRLEHARQDMIDRATEQIELQPSRFLSGTT